MFNQILTILGPSVKTRAPKIKNDSIKMLKTKLLERWNKSAEKMTWPKIFKIPLKKPFITKKILAPCI